MAQMPSLYVEIKSEPKPRVPTFSAPRFTGSSGGEDWWGGGASLWPPPQGQVCTAENALAEEQPWETPRPFHYKLLHFNPLLETMQTLIQKKYKCNKNLRVNTIPGISHHCSHPNDGPGWDTPPQAGLASPHSPVRLYGKGGGLSCFYF